MRFLFQWWVFYPAVLVVSAAVVLLSLGPAILPHEVVPVSGQMADGALLLEGDDLSHAETAPEVVQYVARDVTWKVTALRVAVEPGLGPVKPQETGVRILIAPEASLALGSGPFRVIVQVASVPVTTAPELAISLDRGGEPEWQTKPISVIENTIAYDFPRAAEGVLIHGVGIRPAATLNDYKYGVEIRSIRILSAPSPAT